MLKVEDLKLIRINFLYNNYKYFRKIYIKKINPIDKDLYYYRNNKYINIFKI